MNVKNLVVAVLVSAFLSACNESTGSNSNLSGEQRILNDNLALWQRSGISSYQYTSSKSCFCAPDEPIVVIVVSGQVSEAFRTPSGIYLSAQELASVATIEGMFSKAQVAINQRVARLTVVYNASLGYPESISIDGNQAIADDEITYNVRNFQ